MSYHFELLEDMSKGSEPGIGDCRDQEGVSLLECNGCIMKRCEREGERDRDVVYIVAV